MTVGKWFVRFFGTASFALALIALTNNLAAQTRDYDFGPDGKPTQVSGPGYGQATQPLAGKQAGDGVWHGIVHVENVECVVQRDLDHFRCQGQNVGVVE